MTNFYDEPVEPRPRTRRTKSVVLSSLLGLALFASACGSGEAEVTADTFSSPIDEYLGTDLYGDFGLDASSDDGEEQRKAEEAIAVCMKAQGFEYIPVDYSEFDNFAEIEPGMEWGSDAFFEKYGFGISTLHFSQSQVGPELLGYPDFDFDAIDQNDPNQAAYEAMDDATKAAYDEALWGDSSGFEFDETMTEDEVQAQFDTAEATGCQSEAWGDNSNSEFYEEFGDEMDSLEDDLLKDPKVIKFVDDLKACAAKDGFTVPEDYPEMEKYLQSELSSLQPDEVDEEALMESGPSEEEFAAMSEEELEAYFSDFNDFAQPELSDEAKTKLAEIQKEEVALYQKTADCGGDFNTLMDLYAQVLQEYQEQFVESNKARLDEFKANQG